MKHPRFAIVAAGTGLALLAFALGAGVVQKRADASWDGMVRAAAAIERAGLHREHWREPLWGDSVREPAHPHYDAALAAQAELGDDAHDALMAVIRAGPGGLYQTAADRELFRPTLLLLRRGAHAVDAGEVLTAGLDPFTRAPDLRACRRIVEAAVVEARHQLRAGRGTEAVQWTLDAATFGNDLVRGPLIQQIIGNALTATATVEAWSAGQLDALDDEALDVLAEGLARLDPRMATRLSFDADLVMLARAFAEPEAAGLDFDDRLAAWRYGFSPRWMVADAFHQVQRLMARIDRRSASWTVREAMLEREFAAAQESLNPIVRAICPTLTGVERQMRETLAGVRRLRLRIEHARGRALPELEDPLGDGVLAR